VDLFTKEHLKILLDKSEGCKVSIFMSTFRMGKAIRQNRIRLKNLLREAEAQLLTDNMRSPEVQAILAAPNKLLTDDYFWRHQSDGLALFCSKDDFYVYRVPLNFEELIVVADRFHIKPLLVLFQNDGRFYVLALSQKQIRLLLGTRYSVDEVDLAGVPSSLTEALQFDDPERQLQFQTGTRTPRGRGDRPAIFHGHGVGTNNAKTNLLRYFHKVDKGLGEILQVESAPLILAGVEYLLPIYQEANSYPYLISEYLAGNPDTIQAAELHTQGWQLVRPYFAAKQKEDLERLHQFIGTGSELVSTDLNAVVPAAVEGRVEKLFVPLGNQVWGDYNPDDRTIEVRKKPTPQTLDLLDFTAAHTVLNGGEVYVLPKEQMPGETLIAGMFRYPYEFT
jgi:hypothetical protein